jgi:peptidyl-prolyl cis-trans isomerase C
MSSIASPTATVNNDQAYHLLRISLEHFQKSVGELSEREYQDARRRAKKIHDLESLVLGSEEARGVVVPPEQMDEAIQEVRSRFPDEASFQQVLADNDLDEESLANALYREKMFDAVMRKVSSRAANISDLDVQLYFHMNPEKFSSPETRKPRHILITINPDYPENTREAALARMQEVAEELKANPSPERFEELAHRHSECPSALQGGDLGNIIPGQLYPELDEVLFQLETGEFSDIIETEAGFHIITCDEIKPAHDITLENAQARIRQYLEERQQKVCQKAWLKTLREQAND